MSTADAFKAWLAVPPAAARMLEALHARPGVIVPYAELQAVCRQTFFGVGGSAKHLRAAMDRGSVACVAGAGFRLTSIGKAECARALADAESARATA